MSSANMTASSGVLKQVYGDGVSIQQNLKARAMDELAKSSKKYNAGGQGFFGAIDEYGNESVGAINESEQFRTIDSEFYAQFKIVPKIVVGPIQFSGLVAKATEGDEEAFAEVVVKEMDMARERLSKDLNRQFYGSGTGLLANPAANAASNVSSFTLASAQYLRANMVIDVFNGATKTITSLRILDVDKQSNIVYFSGTIGSALITTDSIVKEHIRDSAPSDGKEMMGLSGIIDDGTILQTFETIDASATRIWRSVAIAAAGGNLTSDLLQRLEDDVEVLGGEAFDIFVMHQFQRRKYLDLVVPQKRFMDGSMDAGFTKLSFNGKELWLDPDCQADSVYGLNKAHLHRYEVAPIALGNHDGSDTFLRLTNFDLFQSYWRGYLNLGTDKRNSHGKISGLAKPSAGVQ